jgi:DtxR family Mn-dependent transcriptional regulator
MVHRTLQPLHRFHAGQRVLIREAQDDNPERLRRWQMQGLVPGALVIFLNYEELDDLFVLQVGEHLIPVGSEALAGLQGELVAEDASTESC